jgi:class 3 adenylate cyclase/tetratricopeptide (TPR) repeat protein
MRCAKCGTENTPTAKFCKGCGMALTRTCPGCGASPPMDARFCEECGSAVAGVGADEPSVLGAPVPASFGPLPGAVSERRVCSVLFADLVGFTSLSETRDPEEVRELLSRYFDIARRTITRYGGIVEKFIGDAVMAVWGTPVAAEGDTERAVRAALELVDAVSVLGADVGASGLSARAGVVTGEVAVTLGAQGEGMVAGDAVNTASRVQSVAKPGSVFVDDATRKLAESAILLEDAGNFELKGKEHPEELFVAVRVLSGVGGNQRSDGLEAPLTGRDAELRALKDLFHTAVDRRTPRLVVVTGAAGVGKSRLGWELEKYIDGLADTVLWHRGRCLSYGEGVAFWALAEIVRQRFGIAEEDATDLARSKLGEGLVRFVSDEKEREYVGVRLSRLLGVPYASETKVVLSQDELYAGWRLFFERLAQVAPVVMLVEDAQHADESLLGFFEHLIDWTKDLTIFVLLFARQGLEAIDSGYGVGRNRTTLSLDPLDDASMKALVEALVPGMPTDARDAITARAQGIPLFAVETVRSLIDQGVLERDGAVYRLAGDLGTLTVPDSLHALLAARLDALPQDVRSLVADASVLGTSFPKEALVAVSGKGEDAVAAALSELVRRDVLHVLADPLSPERGSYRFGQEMLRQVAYETLSKKDRKVRHLAVAAHLRATFANDGEEIADAIARHYLDVLSAAPNDPDAEEITAEALGFLIKSAERAERSGAPARAAESYAEAAAIAPVDQAPALFEKASRASSDYGDFEAAISHADAALRLYLGMGDVRGAARAQSMKGSALQQAGRHTAARVELTEALEALLPDPDQDTVMALMSLAALEIFSGNVAEGQRLATESLALGQALDVGDGDLARCFNTKGLSASHANRTIEAAANYETAARLAERAGVYRALATAQSNLADVLPRTGDLRGAVEAARSSAAHARRTGGRDTLAYAAANLAVALLELGEWEEADAALSAAMQVEHLDHELVHCLVGWLAGLRGEGERATSALESMPNMRLSEEPQAQASVGVLEALVALSTGDVSGALAHAMGVLQKEEAIGIGHESERWAWPLAARTARSLGDKEALGTLLAILDAHPVGHLPPILRAERRLVTAVVAADAEPPGTASVVSAVAEAVVLLREVGNPYQLAHGLVDYAEVLARAGEDGVDAALAEARGIAERLGCAPLLARATSVGSLYAPADASS